MIDWTKPIKTKSGALCRILGFIKRKGEIVVAVAIYQDGTDSEFVFNYDVKTGKLAYSSTEALSLVNYDGN